MLINSRKICSWLEKQFPLHLAEEWDNVGFLIGNWDKTVKKILIALEVTPEVVKEAIDKNVDLIITHHPLIFKGLKRLHHQDPHQQMIRQLIFNDIHVYAAHTNADVADGGLSDIFLNTLGLKAIEGLLPTGRESLLHYSVYVPTDALEVVRTAVHGAGAGNIGNYSQCSFHTSGIGQFLPGESTEPVVGKRGCLEKLEEFKLEFVSTDAQRKVIEEALLVAHPYEKPAYSIMALENAASEHALGRIAELKAPMTLKALGEWVKKELKISHIKLVGDPKQLIQRIGVLTGAGADAIGIAKAKRCDVLITGDIKYHEAQNALAMGLPLMDVGHYNSEILFKTALKKRMSEAFEAMDYDVIIEASTTEKDPFSWI